jgi:hypothetical protein
MTLKEKFHQWLKTEPFNSKYKVTLREAQCEVIADDYAIGFGEWVEELVLEDFDTYSNNSMKQLLEIYKKEKGL